MVTIDRPVAVGKTSIEKQSRYGSVIVKADGIALTTVGIGLELVPLPGIVQILGIPLIVGGTTMIVGGKRTFFSPLQDVNTRE